MTCEWCGRSHDARQLCRANRVGMTRRKFLFLFGAGVAGTVTAARLGLDPAHLFQPTRRQLAFFKGAYVALDYNVPRRTILVTNPQALEHYWRLVMTGGHAYAASAMRDGVAAGRIPAVTHDGGGE
jgi:hypothetical protein